MIDVFEELLNGTAVYASQPLFGAFALWILFMTVIVAIMGVIRP